MADEIIHSRLHQYILKIVLLVLKIINLKNKIDG
jgi:hypothetical protein